MNITNQINASSGALDKQDRADGSADRGELGKDDFLKLLTTQLQAQDPLNPTDNTEFVAQLSQFASLERLENMSGAMQNMALSTSANTSAQMVQFIGRHVRVVSPDVSLSASNPAPTLYANLSADASEMEVDIKDESGKIVRTINVGSADAGMNEVKWDGLRDDGTPAPEGTYTFSMRAKDAEGEPVEAVLSTTQEVKGVTYDGGFPVLLMSSGAEVQLGDVLEIASDDESLAGIATAD